MVRPSWAWSKPLDPSLNSSLQYSHTVVKCSCLELLRIHINRASLKYLPFPWNVVLPSASLCCHYIVYGQCRPVEKDKYILKTKTNLSISYNETDAATGLINRPLIKFFPVSFHDADCSQWFPWFQIFQNFLHLTFSIHDWRKESKRKKTCLSPFQTAFIKPD